MGLGGVRGLEPFVDNHGPPAACRHRHRTHPARIAALLLVVLTCLPT